MQMNDHCSCRQRHIQSATLRRKNVGKTSDILTDIDTVLYSRVLHDVLDLQRSMQQLNTNYKKYLYLSHVNGDSMQRAYRLRQLERYTKNWTMEHRHSMQRDPKNSIHFPSSSSSISESSVSTDGSDESMVSNEIEYRTKTSHTSYRHRGCNILYPNCIECLYEREFNKSLSKKLIRCGTNNSSVNGSNMKKNNDLLFDILLLLTTKKTNSTILPHRDPEKKSDVRCQTNITQNRPSFFQSFFSEKTRSEKIRRKFPFSPHLKNRFNFKLNNNRWMNGNNEREDRLPLINMTNEKKKLNSEKLN
ncbi:hypothetical protein SNEBB_008722 [Seison nebaliae]|nr:hypothetical protein SNEBB_008722 [Seison nebaliae]